MKGGLIVVLFWLVSVAGAAAAPRPQPFLPNEFAGWRIQNPPRLSDEAAAADSAYAGVLREYGFQEVESATYTRPERKLSVKAARFNDATGAYGAFTFYKTEGMQTEKIDDLAASAGTKVLFYRGNVLVEADFDHVTAMSAAELRELSADLPHVAGNKNLLPTLPRYLPLKGYPYVPHSAKYVAGPVAYSDINPPLPAEIIDFHSSPEVVLGRYSTSKGVATLMLIAYPTPQIAGDRLRAIESWTKANSCPSPGRCEFFGKRTGPIVAVVAGDSSSGEAQSLLAAINYDAEVTWNQATSLSKRDNIGNLIIAAFSLIGILLVIALVIGFAFGGVRVLLQKFFPNRWFTRADDADIIRLNLRR